MTETEPQVIEEAIQRVAGNLDKWVSTPIERKVELMKEVMSLCVDGSPELVAAENAVRGGGDRKPFEVVMGALYGTIASEAVWFLEQRAKHDGKVPLPGEAQRHESGAWVVPVYPKCSGDSFIAKIVGPTRTNLWVDPSVSEEDLANLRTTPPEETNKVVGILGAGNFGTLMMLDICHWLFNRDSVAILKVNPVQNEMGPTLERMIQPLVDFGVIAIIYGGAMQGKMVVDHDLIECLHMTGSESTYEAIMWERDENRKAENNPVIQKVFTAELGGVSPFIVAPCNYSSSQLSDVAKAAVESMAMNDGFACCATRVIVTQDEWPQKTEFLRLVEEGRKKLPQARSWYPRSKEVVEDALKTVKQENLASEVVGDDEDPANAPYVMAKNIPHRSESQFFKREFWCGTQANTSIPASDIRDFLEKAAEFCNKELSGNLAAIVYVKPNDLKKPDVRSAVEDCVARLEYGSIGVNTWAANTNPKLSMVWGGYVTNTPQNVQSGIGYMNNFYRLPKVLKCVAYRDSGFEPPIPSFPGFFMNNSMTIRGLAGVMSQKSSPLTLFWRCPVAFFQELPPSSLSRQNSNKTAEI